MTVEDFYQWAKENNCTDYDISVECYDEDGDVSETWLADTWMLKARRNSGEILIKCAEQSYGRENCNMLQKSLVKVVAKNATAQSPLKKLHVGTKTPLKI